MLRILLGFILLAAPLAAVSNQTSRNKTEESMHRKITANQLKSWYDQKKKMVVLDARSKPYFEGTLLPNAIWLPPESPEEEIKAAIPSKDSLIIVYCAGVKCPASGWLYDKLISLGYTDLYEYHEGLEDWMQKGYPTNKK